MVVATLKRQSDEVVTANVRLPDNRPDVQPEDNTVANDEAVGGGLAFVSHTPKVARGSDKSKGFQVKKW